jgi:hypothetical protein
MAVINGRSEAARDLVFGSVHPKSGLAVVAGCFARGAESGSPICQQFHQGEIVLIDLDTGQTRFTIDDTFYQTYSVAWLATALQATSDGRTLLAVEGCIVPGSGQSARECADVATIVWDVTDVRAGEAPERMYQVSHGEGATAGLAFSPDGRLLARFARQEGALQIMDAATGEVLAEPSLNDTLTTSLSSIAFNEDGTLVGLGNAGYVTLYGVPGD